MDPWRYGLLERFDGLVLLGLGPPAILSFVVAVLRRRVRDKERWWGRCEMRKVMPANCYRGVLEVGGEGGGVGLDVVGGGE